MGINVKSHNKSVFVSYSSQDAKLALQVVSILEYEGVACWIAPRDIPSGTQYNQAILDGIESSIIFLLILSENSNNSSHVEVEVERAFHYQKTIIPIRIRDVFPSKKLEYFISNSQWVDAFSSPLHERLRHVSAIVKALEMNASIPTIPAEHVSILGKFWRGFELAQRNLVAVSVIAIVSFSLFGFIALSMVSTPDREIAKKLETLKKETSDDPKKELANKGILWTKESFNNVIKMKDKESTLLFLKGGFDFKGDNAFAVLFEDFNQNKDFLVFLRQNGVNFVNDMDFPLSGGINKALEGDFSQLDWVLEEGDVSKIGEKGDVWNLIFNAMYKNCSEKSQIQSDSEKDHRYSKLIELLKTFKVQPRFGDTDSNYFGYFYWRTLQFPGMPEVDKNLKECITSVINLQEDVYSPKLLKSIKSPVLKKYKEEWGEVVRVLSNDVGEIKSVIADPGHYNAFVFEKHFFTRVRYSSYDQFDTVKVNSMAFEYRGLAQVKARLNEDVKELAHAQNMLASIPSP